MTKGSGRKKQREFTPREMNFLRRCGIDSFDMANDAEEDMPVEYIVGLAEFYGHLFEVNEDVLIPRVETEQLVDLAVSDIKEKFADATEKVCFIDVGCGSGCIGISIASELRRLGISFDGILTDVSPNALNITRNNINKLLSDMTSPEKYRLDAIQSDLLDEVSCEKKFDIIVANLPYIPSNRIPALDKSVKDFEPNIALNGGKDGFDYILELLEQAKEFLGPSGKIFLEVDDTHDTHFLKKLEKTSIGDILKDYRYKTLKDQFGRNRFLLMLLC